MQKLLSLIRSHLFIFVFNFNSITLVGGSQRILLWFLSESVFPMFSSRSFIVSGLTFRSLIHFEFICMYGVRKCFSFILLHVPHPLLSLILNTSASVNMSECYSDHISPMSLQLWNGFLLRIKYQSFQGSVGLCTTWPPTYLTPLLLSPPIPSDWDTPNSYRPGTLLLRDLQLLPLHSRDLLTSLGFGSNATFSVVTCWHSLNIHTHTHSWPFFQFNFPPDCVKPTDILCILFICPLYLPLPRCHVNYISRPSGWMAYSRHSKCIWEMHELGKQFPEGC